MAEGGHVGAGTESGLGGTVRSVTAHDSRHECWVGLWRTDEICEGKVRRAVCLKAWESESKCCIFSTRLVISIKRENYCKVKLRLSNI